MPTKLTEVLDAVPSDAYQVGGESWNQIVKLLKGINVESEEEITINTPFKFNSGKLVFNDQTPNPTHTYTILVENIATGSPRTITIRDTENTADFFALEKQTQTLEKKTLHTGTKFSAVPDFQGFGADNLGPIKIQDAGDRNVTLVEPSNTTTNTYFDFIPNYNTANFAPLSGATDIKVRFGFGSEIDKYEFWSQADGSNSKLLEITETLLGITTGTVNFNNATIQNILLAKSQIPSTVVHTDQANSFSANLQTFRSGNIRLFNPAVTFSYTLVASAITANRNLTLPLLTADDTLAVKGLDNVFGKAQTITENTNPLLTLYRPSSGAVEFGINFDGQSSTSVQRTYAHIKAGISTNTNADEDGYLAFQAIRDGSLLTKMLLNYDGTLWLGTSPARAVLSPANIATSDKTFTFPNISGNIVVDSHNNVFSTLQKISYSAGYNALTLYRPSLTVGDSTGINFSLNNSTPAETIYAAIVGTVNANAAGAESGLLYFQTKSGGAMATRAALNQNGAFYIGNNLRLVLTQTGLTAERIFNFPDVAGVVAVSANANVFTAKQKIQQTGANDHLILYRDVNTVGSAAGVYFKLQNASTTETTFAQILGGIGSNASDNTAGAENGQLYGYVKVAGADTLKLQLTKDRLNTYGVVPVFEVGSADLNSMFIYRPVNSSGSNLITFQLQNASSAIKQFGYMGIRSENVTAGAEIGSVQLAAVEAGTMQLQAKIHSYQTYLYNTGGFAAILNPSGLTTSRNYTFPNLNGMIATDTATMTLLAKTLTAPVLNAGALNGQFTGNTTFELIRDETAGTAEVIARFRISGNTSSYVQFDNATATDGLFVPRLTAVNSQVSTSSAVGMYHYYNIDSTSDSADNFNAVAIFDARRSNSTAIQFKRLFQFRNNATNLFEIYTDKIATSLKLVSATINLDEVTIKHSTTNAAGDIPYFDGTRYTRKAQGSNNQFLGVVGGVLGYYTPTVGGVLALAGLTDDTLISGLQDNDIIRYDSASGKWKNEQLNTTAGLVSNIGGGHEIFKQLAATNELRTLIEGMGIDLTQNTDTITVAIANTVTIPSATAQLEFIKTVGSGEKIMTFGVSDDANSRLIIENGTGVASAFVPQIRFSNITNTNFAGLLVAEIDPANDTGTTAVFGIDTRRTGSAALTTRPMVRFANLGTVEYEWSHTAFDMKGNTLQNAVIASTVTGIVNANIAAGAAIPLSKLDVAGGLATTTSAGFVELATNGETAANVVVQGSDSRLSDSRTPLGHKNSHQFGGSDALELMFNASYDYLIFKNGSTYYLRNNKTGVIDSSNANPDVVFQAALTAGGAIYVFSGDYVFQASGSVVLTMPVSPVYAELYMSPNANLIVPQGYTGVLLQFKHAAVGTAGVTRCKVSGGNMKEGGTRQNLWTAIQFYGDAGVSVAGIYWNQVENVQIYYPKKGIHLLNASGGTLCFMNQNIFRNIIIWYPIEDGVHFDMQNAYVASTNGFHRNRFEYITIQGAGVTSGGSATVGFKDIRHKDNTFIGCYPVDFTGTSKTATIHADAVSTVIMGGSMDALGFTDGSSTTKIISEAGRLTTNGINPSNGNNLDTLMGASATTLTWSFWKTDLSERFYFQKSATQYLFDFVKQTAGGSLRPVLFRQMDVQGSTVESFRIETDATLQVGPSKLVIKDSDNSHKITIVPGNNSADRNLSIPVMAANDTLALLGIANIFTAQQVINVVNDHPLVTYRPSNAAADRMGIRFDANNSTPAQTSYAAIVGEVITNTAGSEDGQLRFQTKLGGSLATKMLITKDGALLIGPNSRLGFAETGLSALRNFTFPNADGEVATTSASQTLASKTIQGLKTTVTAKTAAYTLLQTDDFIPCDATSAGFTITLPAASASAGKIFQIQKIDSSANTVTISRAGSDTINGNTTMLLTAQYQSVTLQCNGTVWYTQPYSVERRGKSTATGNGSATVFNLPHGLGVIPHDVIPTCRTHTILSYTADATNIIVTLTAAPANAASVIFDWSAVP